MKIGILTYHRAHNYGAMLQAIATQYVLSKAGHDAFFVDYYPDYHKKRYELRKPSLKRLFRHPLAFWRELRLMPNKKKRIESFLDFQAKYIDPYCRSEKEHFDSVVYGSDQIWRKQQPRMEYNPIYFGVGLNASKHVSYAASIDSIPQTDVDLSSFKQLLQNLNQITVRENALRECCKSLGFDADLVIDPTFLMDSDEWDSLLNLKSCPSEKYAVFYSIRKGAFNKSLMESFCAKRGWSLVEITANPNLEDSCRIISTGSPSDFVRLIRNAEFVFTSSFHGMAFAINYKKQFLVSTDFAAERITSLLDLCGLQNRYIDGAKNIPELDEIDYEMVFSKISVLKDCSKKALLSMVM